MPACPRIRALVPAMVPSDVGEVPGVRDDVVTKIEPPRAAGTAGAGGDRPRRSRARDESSRRPPTPGSAVRLGIGAYIDRESETWLARQRYLDAVVALRPQVLQELRARPLSLALAYWTSSCLHAAVLTTAEGREPPNLADELGTELYSWALRWRRGGQGHTRVVTAVRRTLVAWACGWAPQTRLMVDPFGEITYRLWQAPVSPERVVTDRELRHRIPIVFCPTVWNPGQRHVLARGGASSQPSRATSMSAWIKSNGRPAPSATGQLERSGPNTSCGRHGIWWARRRSPRSPATPTGTRRP